MSISQYKNTQGKTLWRVRYTKPDGTRTDKRGFTTKTAARQWEARIITGTTTPGSRHEPTIKDLEDTYLTSISTLTPGTQDVYKTALRTHVLPRWGRTKPSDLTQRLIQEWINSEGFSRSVAGRNIAVLRGLLKASGYPADSTNEVAKPRRQTRENTYLTATQLTALAEASDYPGIIYTLGLVGLRWGELAGLRVKDYNGQRQELHVKQTASMIRGELVIGPPKSGKSRIVMVPDTAAAHIRRASADRREDDPIFPGPSGDYMRRPKGRSWFDGAKKRAHDGDESFPLGLRIHDLRHTAASLMVQSGAHVKLVQHQLGHASASLTMDTYADLFPEDLGTLRAAMNDLF